MAPYSNQHRHTHILACFLICGHTYMLAHMPQLHMKVEKSFKELVCHIPPSEAIEDPFMRNGPSPRQGTCGNRNVRLLTSRSVRNKF